MSSALRVCVVAAAIALAVSACTGGGNDAAHADSPVSSPAPTGTLAASPTASGTQTPAASTAGSTVDGPADGQSGGQPAQQVSLPLPGLDGLDRWAPAVTGQTVRFAAAGGCPSVLDLLDAGQWATTVLMTPDDVAEQLRSLAPWYLAQMRNGSRSAYLKLIAGRYDCEATVIPATSQTIAVSGAESAHGTASFQPFECGPDPMGSDTMNLHGLYSLPGDRHLIVSASVPAAVGDGEVDSDGSSPVVTLAHSPSSDIALMVEALKQNLATGDDMTVPGSVPYAASDDSMMEVTVSSLYPFQGEIRLTGLTGTSGARLDVTASFSCDTTPLPKDPSDGDASTGGDSGKTDTRGSVTVDVSSGPLKGTHTASGDLSCDYGTSAPHGWWLLFSATDDNGQMIDNPAATDLSMMQMWSAPADEAAAPGALFDEPFVLDLGFGDFVVNKAQQLHVSRDAGGRGGDVQRNGDVVTYTATTAEGPTVTVTANCPAVTTQ